MQLLLAAVWFAVADGVRRESLGGLSVTVEGDGEVLSGSNAAAAARALVKNHTRQRVYGEKVAHAGSPLLSFPEELCSKVVCSSTEPVHLGAGSFGESWLVTDRDEGSPTYRKQVVMKLLYVQVETVELEPHHERRPKRVWREVQMLDSSDRPLLDAGGEPLLQMMWEMVDEDEVINEPVTKDSPKYLQYQDCPAGSEHLEQVAEAEEECNIAALLHKGSTRPASAKGAQRIAACFGSNIGTSPTAPMYLLMENGGQDLTTFMEQKTRAGLWTSALVGSIFKQLLEALAYLSSFSPAWIHHDLKPENVVIKEHPEDPGRHIVHLIDFGGTVQATPGHRCSITPSTQIFAPSEWFGSGGGCSGNLNFDAERPDAFDLFAAGAILLQMLTGSFMFELVRRSMDGELLNHPRIHDRIVKHAESFVSKLTARDEYTETLEPFKRADSSEHQFLMAALKLLSLLPEDRPAVSDLLVLSFMQEADSPDDPAFDAVAAIDTKCAALEEHRSTLRLDVSARADCDGGVACSAAGKVPVTLVKHEGEQVTIEFTMPGAAEKTTWTVSCDSASLSYEASSGGELFDASLREPNELDAVVDRPATSRLDATSCPEKLVQDGCAHCVEYLGDAGGAGWYYCLTYLPMDSLAAGCSDGGHFPAGEVYKQFAFSYTCDVNA